MNKSLILEGVDPQTLSEDIAAAVVAALRPLIEQATARPPRFVGRDEMARQLGWSVDKLSRRTRDGCIPSMLDGNRRTYEVAEVVAAIRANTEKAEAKAADRHAAKVADLPTKKGASE